MLAIKVSIGDDKFVFFTELVHLDLGKLNHNSIIDSIKSMFLRGTPIKMFTIGDFNLSSADWPLDENSESSVNRIDRLFVDSFNELGLEQC